MWVGFLLHGCRGFASPIIEAIKMSEDRPKKIFPANADPLLAHEVIESLNAIKLIVDTDP